MFGKGPSDRLVVEVVAAVRAAEVPYGSGESGSADSVWAPIGRRWPVFSFMPDRLRYPNTESPGPRTVRVHGAMTSTTSRCRPWSKVTLTRWPEPLSAARDTL